MSNETQRLTGRADPADVDAVRSALSARFGNRAPPALAVQQHANTMTWVANQPPDVVVFRNRPTRSPPSSSCAPTTSCR